MISKSLEDAERFRKSCRQEMIQGSKDGEKEDKPKKLLEEELC